MLPGWKRLIASAVGLLIMAGQQAGWIPIETDTAAIIAAVDLFVVLGLSIYEKTRAK